MRKSAHVSRRTIIIGSLMGFITIAGSLVGLMLLQQNQDTRQQAAGGQCCGANNCSPNNEYCAGADCKYDANGNITGGWGICVEGGNKPRNADEIANDITQHGGNNQIAQNAKKRVQQNPGQFAGLTPTPSPSPATFNSVLPPGADLTTVNKDPKSCPGAWCAGCGGFCGTDTTGKWRNGKTCYQQQEDFCSAEKPCWETHTCRECDIANPFASCPTGMKCEKRDIAGGQQAGFCITASATVLNTTENGSEINCLSIREPKSCTGNCSWYSCADTCQKTGTPLCTVCPKNAQCSSSLQPQSCNFEGMNASVQPNSTITKCIGQTFYSCMWNANGTSTVKADNCSSYSGKTCDAIDGCVKQPVYIPPKVCPKGKAGKFWCAKGTDGVKVWEWKVDTNCTVVSDSFQRCDTQACNEDVGCVASGGNGSVATTPQTCVFHNGQKNITVDPNTIASDCDENASIICTWQPGGLPLSTSVTCPSDKICHPAGGCVAKTKPTKTVGQTPNQKKETTLPFSPGPPPPFSSKSPIDCSALWTDTECAASQGVCAIYSCGGGVNICVTQAQKDAEGLAVCTALTNEVMNTVCGEGGKYGFFDCQTGDLNHPDTSTTAKRCNENGQYGEIKVCPNAHCSRITGCDLPQPTPTSAPLSSIGKSCWIASDCGNNGRYACDFFLFKCKAYTGGNVCLDSGSCGTNADNVVFTCQNYVCKPKPEK